MGFLCSPLRLPPPKRLPLSDPETHDAYDLTSFVCVCGAGALLHNIEASQNEKGGAALACDGCGAISLWCPERAQYYANDMPVLHAWLTSPARRILGSAACRWVLMAPALIASNYGVNAPKVHRRSYIWKLVWRKRTTFCLLLHGLLHVHGVPQR